MNWKDIHITSTNIMGFTMIGVLASTLTSLWWSCADGSIEVMRAWILGATLGSTGLFTAITARHFKLHRQMQYYTELGLRVMLVYAVVTTALLKAEGHYYNYTLFSGETKLANLEAQSFANAFYGFSPLFQSYIGYVILGGLFMISFKRSQRIGNIILGGVLANAVMLNVSFDSCFVYKNGIYLATVIYFIFADLPSYMAFVTRNKNHENEDYHPLTNNEHLRNSSVYMKIVLWVGLLLYNHDYISDIQKYRSKNADSPITGVWNVRNVEFFRSDIPEENKKEIEQFSSIILDKGRFGAVEIADSLSFFEYLIIPDDNQLEFWNFQDFYHLDLKGRYRQISEDSMIYIGKNNKDSLLISLKKSK